MRKETAPASITPFPGRAWLYRDSHAFFALRQWLYRWESDSAVRVLPSDGTWQDLVDLGNYYQARAKAAGEETRLAAELHCSHLRYASMGELTSDKHVNKARLRPHKNSGGTTTSSISRVARTPATS